MLVILLLAFLYLFSHVNASHFIIRGRHTSPHLNKRAHVSGLDNGQNLKYYTNITLGEIPFSVGIDTGRQVAHLHPLYSSIHPLTSSDLWVAGNVSNSINTGVSTGVDYAIGAIDGSVRTAQLTFLDFIVPDQAFSMFDTCSRPSTTYSCSSSGSTLFCIP
jgi:hypothetical protein